jgi:hypothetical protein
MPGEAASGLRDDGCIDKVMEELERAHTPVDDRLAMRTVAGDEAVRLPSEGSRRTGYVYRVEKG